MALVPRLTLGVLGALLAVAVQAGDGKVVLRDLDGQPRQLEDLVGGGKWTVVMFWASDCRVCNQEAPAWSLFDAKRRDSDARVVGVSMDGQGRLAEARAFVERHLLDFPNLIGEPDAVMRLFTDLGRQPFLGTPSFLVYGPDGQLRARQVGALPPDKLEAYIAKRSAQ